RAASHSCAAICTASGTDGAIGRCRCGSWDCNESGKRKAESGKRKVRTNGKVEGRGLSAFRFPLPCSSVFICGSPTATSMRPDNLDKLKEDLIGFRAELEEPGVRAGLLETGLPRLLATLEMIPSSYSDKSILELGSSPYFLSLCLYRMCTGTLKRGNYFGPDAKHGADRLVNARTGEEVVFQYEAFNIETDPFPYPDEHFDVVVFSELIEHLGVNPVRALAEIHRVLRPNGVVIVTTPNSLSLERFATFLRAGSQMVDRYSPLFG